MTGVQCPLACQSGCWRALIELELWPEEVSTSDRTGNSCAHRQKCTSFSSLSDQTCFSSPKIKLTRTCHLVENNFADAIRLQALLSCEIQLNFSSYPNYYWMQVAAKPTTCPACVICWRAAAQTAHADWKPFRDKQQAPGPLWLHTLHQHFHDRAGF